MRTLFVGYLGRGQTSGMRCAALRRLGHDVVAVDAGRLWSGASYLSRQVGQRRRAGRRIEQLNSAVLAAADQHRPALMWAEKQEYLWPATLQELRRRGIVTLHYNPDPYFSLAWKQTPLADECLRLYDALIVTKRYELDAYRRHASGEVIYSPLGYDPVSHAPPAIPAQQAQHEVVFVGGWEPRRAELLAAALAVTPRIAVWGYGWKMTQDARLNPLRALRLGRLTPGRDLYFGAPNVGLSGMIRQGEDASGEIYEERYASAVAGARVALGFVREICADQHTTRTFEIPAIGGFMLAHRTDEHLELFVEGKEAEFFASDEEYLEKMRYYLANEPARARVAHAGHVRCMTSGYAYDDRIRAVMTALDIPA